MYNQVFSKRHIVLSNQLDKGYDFENTEGFTPEELKIIYQNALPRGNQWNESTYQNIRSIKTFKINQLYMGISIIESSAQEDDKGRSGILHATISVVSANNYIDELKNLNKVIQKSTIPATPLNIPMSKIFSSILFNRQVKIVHPFIDKENWVIVEKTILKFILSLPTQISIRMPFTTFALTHRNEALIIALPEENIEEYDEPYIRL